MSKPPKAPNVLLLWTDEQRADTMACYGNTFVQAPRLNRLAEQSFVFENAYCATPVCTPSRATIMTGLLPHTHRCIENNTPLDRETRTIAEMLDDRYRCAYFGKWHLGDEVVAQHGFDDWVSIEDEYRAFYSDPKYPERFSDYHHDLVSNGFAPVQQRADGAKVFSRREAALMTERFTKAGFLGRRVSQYLHEHDRSRPFFLSVNFLEPHMPFYGPLNDLHDPAAIPVGPAFAKPPGDDASLRNRIISAQYRQIGADGIALDTEAGWRRLRANYLGLVTLVDQAVGMILDALEAAGLADDTIVVYTSDHGDMMGDHAQVAKCVIYEQATRIPLLMRVPWLESQPAAVPGRISQIDLVPTLLELLDQPRPSHLQGVSRAEVLHGDATLADNDIVIEWNGREGAQAHVAGFTDEQIAQVRTQVWRCIVTAEGWKLNQCATDRCELFDLNADPHELVNRIDDPALAPRLADMRNRLRTWQQRTGDNAAIGL